MKGIQDYLCRQHWISSSIQKWFRSHSRSFILFLALSFPTVSIRQCSILLLILRFPGVSIRQSTLLRSSSIWITIRVVKNNLHTFWKLVFTGEGDMPFVFNLRPFSWNLVFTRNLGSKVSAIAWSFLSGDNPWFIGLFGFETLLFSSWGLSARSTVTFSNKNDITD